MHLIYLLKGAIATTMTQPLDVLKTRAMNAKPGEYRVSSILMIVSSILMNMHTIHFLK